LQDVLRTTSVLIAYSSGLWIYILLQIINKVFYSLNDAITPMRITSWCVLINLGMNFILVFPFQETGLAIATSLNALIQATAFFYFLNKKIVLCWKGMGKIIFTCLFSTSIMAASVLAVLFYLPQEMNLASRFYRVFLPLLAGIFVYCCSFALFYIRKRNSMEVMEVTEKNESN
jgi:putative peptidoglycan lipid II flippase